MSDSLNQLIMNVVDLLFSLLIQLPIMLMNVGLRLVNRFCLPIQSFEYGVLEFFGFGMNEGGS